MEKRGIPRRWIERVLFEPVWIEPDPVDGELEHRLGPIEEFGSRVLRVVVRGGAHPPLVITAFFDRRRLPR